MDSQQLVQRRPPAGTDAATRNAARDAGIDAGADDAIDAKKVKRDLSPSLLDDSAAHLTATMGLILGFAWAADVLVEAWWAGRLLTEFQALGSMLDHMPLVVLINAASGCFITFAWVLPSASKFVGHVAAVTMYGLCQAVTLLAPPLFLRAVHPTYHPIIAIAILMHHCVFIMKAHSYFFVVMKNTDAACSLRQWALYVMFPTLIYKPRCDYERTDSVRLGYVASHLAYAFASFTVLYVLLVSDVVPLVQQFPTMGFLRLWFRLLVPAFCMFLVAFYGTFHCLLNAFSEILMYADRDFYRDWWNSNDMGEWTRKWNSTVQDWIAHQYLWMRHTLGIPKVLAMVLSIFLSACWHDFILAFAFRRLSFWTVAFMMLQVFLISISRTRIAGAINKKIGPILVLLMLPLGFALLIASYAITFMFCNKSVCLPHELVLLSLYPPVIVNGTTA